LREGWEWVRLENIVSILGDGLHGTPEYSDAGEYFFVNGNNLSNGKIEIKKDTKRISQLEFDKYKKELNVNTVFVSINGTIGNLAFYSNEKIVLGKSACYFNLLEGVDKFYIGILIKSPYFLDYARMVASRTTISNISLKSMRHLVIPFPPLAEQKRIVAKVEQLLALCNALESRLRTGEAVRRQMVETVLTGLGGQYGE
jgi:type I restriction enzyme, S subunit